MGFFNAAPFDIRGEQIFFLWGGEGGIFFYLHGFCQSGCLTPPFNRPPGAANCNAAELLGQVGLINALINSRWVKYYLIHEKMIPCVLQNVNAAVRLPAGSRCAVAPYFCRLNVPRCCSDESLSSRSHLRKHSWAKHQQPTLRN